MALADFHGPTGVWPSIDSLTEHTCQDRRTVQRNLRKLEEAGYLRLTGKIHNGPRTYALMPDPKAAAIAPPQRNTQGRQYAAPWSPKGRHHAAPGAAIGAKRGGNTPPNLDRSLLIHTEPLKNGEQRPGIGYAEWLKRQNPENGREAAETRRPEATGTEGAQPPT